MRQKYLIKCGLYERTDIFDKSTIQSYNKSSVSGIALRRPVHVGIKKPHSPHEDSMRPWGVSIQPLAHMMRPVGSGVGLTVTSPSGLTVMPKQRVKSQLATDPKE